MGVTYHANYLVWFEVGRTDWLRHHGWTYREMERAGFRLPVIEASCRYLAPARYDDELEVHTRATLVTPARVRFDYEVRLAGAGPNSRHRIHRARRPGRGGKALPRARPGEARDGAGPARVQTSGPVRASTIRRMVKARVGLVLALAAALAACGGNRNVNPQTTGQPDRFLMDRATEAMGKRNWLEGA